MNLFEEAARIILGITITGVVGAVIWLFKWVDKVDLRIHDITRDINHIQRQYAGLSEVVAKLDLKDEQLSAWIQKDFQSIDRRIAQIEFQIQALEVLMNPSSGSIKPNSRLE